MTRRPMGLNATSGASPGRTFPLGVVRPGDVPDDESSGYTKIEQQRLRLLVKRG